MQYQVPSLCLNYKLQSRTNAEWIAAASIVSVMFLASPERLPPFYCDLHFYMAIVILMQALMLLDAIIVVKVILIFWMKNLTAVQDEFWRVS